MNAFLHRIALAMGLAFSVAACVTVPAKQAARSNCEIQARIGLFDPSGDLLIANFDSKPDVDDLQAVAALGTVLRDPAFACVDMIATHGAYGLQTGTFLPADRLFTLAFGDRWLDAHRDREATIAALAGMMRETIAEGGKVWVAEAGQSDLTAKAVKQLPQTMWGKINIVQHSYWNETMTSKDAMDLLVYNTRYHRVQDGNFSGNGSPAYNTKDASAWRPLLSSPRSADIWSEAKRLSDKHNPVAEYVNPAVAAGGLDFSDAVEIAYIFGFDDQYGVDEFVARFAPVD